MSIKLHFAISNPLSTTSEEVNNKFYIGTYKVQNYRALLELSKPNTRDLLDLKAELLDSNDGPNPGLYCNFLIFGFGVHITFYKI